MTLIFPTLELHLAALCCLVAFVFGAVVGYATAYLDKSAGAAGKARDA